MQSFQITKRFEATTPGRKQKQKQGCFAMFLPEARSAHDRDECVATLSKCASEAERKSKLPAQEEIASTRYPPLQEE